MLHIQEFIFHNPDWRERLAAPPYNLKISEDDGFVLFKYNQLSSDFSEPICCEARGLILDSFDGFRVVRRAFDKFFNIDEQYAAKIDWTTATASEKIDGSLMSVWYARDKWHLSTNGTVDAHKAELSGEGPFRNFGDLFESVLPLSFFDDKNPDMIWTFELVGPWNRVVLTYPETKVYLLSIRSQSTFEEHSPDALSMVAEFVGIPTPKFYDMNDEKGFRAIVDQMDDTHEGIVVRDASGNRVKIKTDSYFTMHHAYNNGVITKERIVGMIMTGEDAEFLSYFPHMEPTFEKIRDQLTNALIFLAGQKFDVDVWKEKNPNATRRDFAMWVNEKPQKARTFLFKLYDGRDAAKCLYDLSYKKIVEYFVWED